MKIKWTIITIYIYMTMLSMMSNNILCKMKTKAGKQKSNVIFCLIMVKKWLTAVCKKIEAEQKKNAKKKT